MCSSDLLNRLGAIARRYVPNLYGISSSPLHRGLPTDRLVAEWWLDSPRVRAAETGQPLHGAATGMIEFNLDHTIEGIAGTQTTHAVQEQLRGRLQEAFAAGQVVSEFRNDGAERGMYFLTSGKDLPALG